MHTVLILDDQQDLLDITRLFLERFGEMNVDTAKTAKEALSKMKDRVFDALVVDFDLPDISGIEFLKIVRAKGDTTPIIIFTGVGRENAAIEALNNGADFFLKKGEDPHSQFRNMVHMINQAVERRSMGRAIGTSERLLTETIAFFSDRHMPLTAKERSLHGTGQWLNLPVSKQRTCSEKAMGNILYPFSATRHPCSRI